MYARQLIKPVEATALSEYQAAEWIHKHAPDRRVYATGATMVILNTIADNPQVLGCCEQSLLLPLTQIIEYTIGSDENAGDRAIDISIAWLKAFGAALIVVPGADSTDPYRAYYRHPLKFEGRLRVLWRNAGNVIYEVPQRSNALAHLVRESELATRVPVHGLDIAPMEAYIQGIESPDRPQLTATWKDTRTLRVTGNWPAGFVVSLQMPYHAGWLATVNGRPAQIAKDALGFAVLRSSAPGEVDIRLTFDHWRELQWCRLVSWAVFLALAALAVAQSLRG